ncbi:MAG: tetratricopeptide repeat protein, partial [Candidatus Cloacimonetes bacterium]|nr:tetratricopeptide repeat protein [Candidatus Cloacimonadota bacterium]
AINPTLQYSMALKHYLRSLALDPENLRVVVAIAGCYLALGEYRLALIYYKRIPDPPEEILYNIGYAQALMGSHQECIDTMQKLRKRLPKHPYVYFVIIEQYIEMRESDEAMRYLRKAQECCPDHVQLNLFAGLIYSDKKMWLQAYYYYRKASKMAKINNPEHMIRYSAAALQTGLPQESISILLQCEKAWPYLSEIYLNLVKTYLFIGDTKSAASVIKRAKNSLSHLSPALKIMQERLKKQE